MRPFFIVGVIMKLFSLFSFIITTVCVFGINAQTYFSHNFTIASTSTSGAAHGLLGEQQKALFERINKARGVSHTDTKTTLALAPQIAEWATEACGNRTTLKSYALQEMIYEQKAATRKLFRLYVHELSWCEPAFIEELQKNILKLNEMIQLHFSDESAAARYNTLPEYKDEYDDKLVAKYGLYALRLPEFYQRMQFAIGMSHLATSGMSYVVGSSALGLGTLGAAGIAGVGSCFGAAMALPFAGYYGYKAAEYFAPEFMAPISETISSSVSYVTPSWMPTINGSSVLKTIPGASFVGSYMPSFVKTAAIGSTNLALSMGKIALYTALMTKIRNSYHKHIAGVSEDYDSKAVMFKMHKENLSNLMKQADKTAALIAKLYVTLAKRFKDLHPAFAQRMTALARGLTTPLEYSVTKARQDRFYQLLSTIGLIELAVDFARSGKTKVIGVAESTQADQEDFLSARLQDVEDTSMSVTNGIIEISTPADSMELNILAQIFIAQTLGVKKIGGLLDDSDAIIALDFNKINIIKKLAIDDEDDADHSQASDDE